MLLLWAVELNGLLFALLSFSLSLLSSPVNVYFVPLYIQTLQLEFLFYTAFQSRICVEPQKRLRSFEQHWNVYDLGRNGLDSFCIRKRTWDFSDSAWNLTIKSGVFQWEGRLVMTNLHFSLDWIQITCETCLWVLLWGSFQNDLVEMKTHLNLYGTMSWSWVEIK